MKVVYSDKSLELYTGRSPESGERLTAILDFLKKKGLSQNDIVEPSPASEEDLLLVHERTLIEELKLRSKRELSVPDNEFRKNTFEIALLSAGAALDAARIAEKEFAFALERPPGHHAGIRTFGGFCYLNNIAFAIRKIQQEKHLKKALIVDFDVHLGQGTLEIFQDDPSVFYLSLHQNPNTIYPWRDFGLDKVCTKKVDFLPGVGDEEYVRRFREETLKAVEEFEPEIIGVSAGFDIFYRDQVVASNLGIKKVKTFNEIGSVLKETGKPCFAVLEGGYTLETLGEIAYNFLKPFF